METMKPWQYNFQLEYLKEIEKKYEEYNTLSLSPFSKYKKNNIALDLHEKNLFIHESGCFVCKTSKTSSAITMYQDVKIAQKQKGDFTISNLIGTEDYVRSTLRHFFQYPTWFYCWSEDLQINDIALSVGYRRIGTKITSFGELITIFFSDSKRDIQPLDVVESIALKKIMNVDVSLINKISNTLDNLKLNFKNHYSNYNKNDSWSAISLRGYSPDVSFIEKPSAMDSSWKKNHKENNYEIQDTELMPLFPEIYQLTSFIDGYIDRIRFMKLSPNQGELERHTDQVDSSSGGSIGKLARLHFPIVTNENVNFSVWNTNGIKQTENMKIGELWYLDTRKPHTVINSGVTDRTHLVVDCIVTQKIYNLLTK